METGFNMKKSSGFEHYQQQLFKPKILTRRLMIPLTLLVLITTIGIVLALYQLHRYYLQDTFTKNLSAINNNFDVLLNEQASSLALAVNIVASDPNVQRRLS